MTTDLDPFPVVTVAKRKLQGGRACWNAYQIDRDAAGVWLFTPAGSTFRSSDGHRDEECEVEGGGGAGLDSLILVPPPSSNWMATWHAPTRRLDISIEICAWIRQDDQVACFVDWELDPFRLRSGLVAVEDLDDFADARQAGLFAEKEAERAFAAAAWTERALRSHAAPFDTRGDRRLAEASTLQLPALLKVPHPFQI